MASEDVIELGSSDDEAEPAPKKKKPTLNAMVHFPNKVPGLVVKPSKNVLPPLQKVLASGAVTITNVTHSTIKLPLQVHKVKPNGRPLPKLSQKNLPKISAVRSVYKPLQVPNNLSINPISFVKSQQHRGVRIQSPKINLPPGITVTRTADQKVLPAVTVSRKRQIIRKKPPEKIIPTVELDDEADPVTSGASPQWYLRPEEQTELPANKKEGKSDDKHDSAMETENTMESENNKEPDTSKYIEITIEDSPVKPIQTKRTHEVCYEIPITIEDSPVKLAAKESNLSSVDGETQSISVPQSKKKLDYPKEKEVVISSPTDMQNIIEIDLEKPVCTEEADNKTKDKIEVELDAVKSVQTVHVTQEVKGDEKSNELIQGKEDGEFHPVYQRFINLCFQLENSEDMTKIVEKKIKTYYRQCPKEYVESEDFIDMVSSKIFAMKAGPDKMYLYIKDIVDELNLQRKSAKAGEVLNKENKEKGNAKYFCADDAEYDSKRRRQIRKLEKTIKKLHRAVQKLEEQEVEFEDEEDSVYLLTERYKERLIRVHAKFCQLTNTKMPSEPRIQIEARPGQPNGPAKRLEKWVNRKVPIGTPLPFPDFHDVLRCVREANDEDRLGWNEADIMEEARDLFVRCGKKLQRRRQENEWRIAVSRISHDVSTLDPAEESDVLRKRLEENKSLAAKKETDVLNKYADKQNQLKLVAEEIGDKEAEESPVESEEDEGDDSNSLEDKLKRKERLRRLLHEKTRKLSAEKENISNNEPKTDKEEIELVAEKIEGDVKVTASEENQSKKEEIPEIIKETKAEVVSDDIIPDIKENVSINDEKPEKGVDDESYDVDSDIDELHLLQKLYSDNEINSSLESDSDTPIAISDTLDSDSDTGNKKEQEFDIISIENSSYSESEMTKDEYSKELESDSIKDTRVEGMQKSKVDDYDENILLASSDEESGNTDTCVKTDKVNKISCPNTLVNDDVTTNNDDIILDNDEVTSEGNNMVIDKVYSIEIEENFVTNVMIVDDNFDDTGNNNDNEGINGQNNLKVNESQSQKDKSMNTESDIQKGEDNLKVIDSTSNNVITNEYSGEDNCMVTKEIGCENDVDNCKSTNNTNDGRYVENNMNDKISTAGENVISEIDDDNLGMDNLLQGRDIIRENEEHSPNSDIETVLDSGLSECEMDNINVEMEGIETTASSTNVQMGGIETTESSTNVQMEGIDTTDSSANQQVIISDVIVSDKCK